MNRPQSVESVFLLSVFLLLAKKRVQCYYLRMNILKQLDTKVTNLLQRLDQAQGENSALQDQIASLKQEIAALEEKEQSLTTALVEQEDKRTKALAHIEMLLQKIQDFENR